MENSIYVKFKGPPSLDSTAGKALTAYLGSEDWIKHFMEEPDTLVMEKAYLTSDLQRAFGECDSVIEWQGYYPPHRDGKRIINHEAEQ